MSYVEIKGAVNAAAGKIGPNVIMSYRGAWEGPMFLPTAGYCARRAMTYYTDAENARGSIGEGVLIA